MVGQREHPDAGGEGEPEADRDREQLQTRQDQQPTADDDHERERQPDRHPRPPEVERVGAILAEDQEAEDEPDVRRVEDVASAEADHVLGEQCDCSRRDVDPPAVEAPPIAVLRARDAQDEGDAVAGQERAGRPHDHPVAPERDRELEHGAGPEGDEDLRDRQVEAERRLPQHLQRHDHGCEVQSRVAERRQQDGVRRAADQHGPPASSGRCSGAHRPPMVVGSALPLTARRPDKSVDQDAGLVRS